MAEATTTKGAYGWHYHLGVDTVVVLPRNGRFAPKRMDHWAAFEGGKRLTPWLSTHKLAGQYGLGCVRERKSSDRPRYLLRPARTQD